MAKVTSPLFSMSASGQLGKSLVYMTWKGVKDVRTYVVPANPKSGGQQLQRGYMTSAVTAWHHSGFSALDVTAWNAAALAIKAVASGFNIFTKYFIAAMIAGHTWTPLTQVDISAVTTTTATVKANVASDKTGKLYLGTSSTSMLVPFTGTFLGSEYTFSLTGLSASTKYFFYIINTSTGEAARSGVYTLTTPAA